MKVVLAEKPSVARDIAEHLGARQRNDGFLSGNGYQVTWALGHLAELKSPEEYRPEWKAWRLETLPILPEKFELKPRGDAAARRQLGVVSRLLREADEIIGATDAGREGELIFRYILDLARVGRKPLSRLWLSSLTPAAIRAAFANLRPASDFENLHRAARCRSEADWIVGLNATRNFTVRHRQSGHLWSAGRVQTPVLAMIVQRDHEIRVFRPEPFWELFTRYRDTWFKFRGERFAAREGGQQLLEKTRGRPFRIVRVLAREERTPPPLLYDLTELQRDMNRRFGMSAADVLSTAQSLYEAKLITYPRTDSRYLSSAMREELPGIMRSLADAFLQEVSKLDLAKLPIAAGTSRIIDDRRVGDHHAIIPTGAATGSLSGPRERVYRAVAIRLIAAFYPACRKAITTVDGESNEVPFRAVGVRVLDPGWTELYPPAKKKPSPKNEPGANETSEERDLPEFREGESGPHEPLLKEGRTTTPSPYTENTLLGAMESAGRLVEEEELKAALKDCGLGTPATRAAIIETLLERQYIAREGKNLIATELGRYLIALVQEPSLKSPELTGQWEARLREVEAGKLAPEAFSREIAAYTRRIIEGSDLEAIDDQRLGNCPLCGKPVVIGKRDFGCSGWRDGCRFVLARAQGGLELTDRDVRQLLQKGVAIRPSGGDEAVRAALILFSGQVIEIEPPAAAEGRFSRKGKAPSRSKRSAKGPSKRASTRGSKRASKRTGGRPTAAGQRRAGPAARRAAAAGSESSKPPRKRAAPQRAATPASGLGACPVCRGAVAKREGAYRCERAGCGFSIAQTIAGRDVTSQEASLLLARGRTPSLSGFQSSSGAQFSARLVLRDGEVRFEYDD